MMRLVIISGRSGSGKSTALHVLEDTGFSCIDNLPASLLPALIQHMNTMSDKPNVAISIDARNTSADLLQLPQLVDSSIMDHITCQVLFIDASDSVLLQRFSETRRKHPLSDEQTDLREAIRLERRLLDPIADVADLILDTSDMGLHDLRDQVKQRIMGKEAPGVAILFQSFGFKHGIPKDADLVFDARCLPNPHWVMELRALDGRDQPVADFLSTQDEVTEMLNDITVFLERWLPRYEANNRSYITIAVGCTGGQHRSVYLCERLNNFFKNRFNNVQSRHRELKVTPT